MTDTTAARVAAIERQLDLRADPARVWQALTDPAELARWFGQRAELDLRPGGAGWFEWDDGGRYHALVDVVEPGRRLAYRWASEADTPVQAGQSTLVEFELDQLPGGGTRLRLRETGFDTDASRFGNVRGWLDELAELAELLATQPWQAGIRRTYRFGSPLDRVWRAFSDSAEFSAWWGDIGELRIEPGASGWFSWPTEGRHAVRYEAVEPPRYLAWSWTIERDVPLDDAQEVLRTEWVLSEAPDGGTIVELFESGFIGPANHEQNAIGWDTEVEPELRRQLGEVA